MGVAIRDIIADYKTPVTWESLPGVAAIDANNALYQFLTIIRQPDGTPLMDFPSLRHPLPHGKFFGKRDQAGLCF
jgi:hypothetical protein